MTNDGKVYAWGAGGNLGFGDSVRRDVPTVLPSISNVIAIATNASDSNVALTTNGDIYSWGNNINGQLGLGSIQSALPTIVLPF